MSATILIPDKLASCRTLLRGGASQVQPAVAAVITELTTVYITSPGWIDTFIPDPAQLPRNGIRVRDAGGLGPYPERPGYTRERVQFDCYGSTARLASAIATLVRLALVPSQRNQQGWQADGTRVVGTLSLTGPLPGIEPNTDPPVPVRTITAELLLLEEGRA